MIWDCLYKLSQILKLEISLLGPTMASRKIMLHPIRIQLEKHRAMIVREVKVTVVIVNFGAWSLRALTCSASIGCQDRHCKGLNKL